MAYYSLLHSFFTLLRSFPPKSYRVRHRHFLFPDNCPNEFSMYICDQLQQLQQPFEKCVDAKTSVHLLYQWWLNSAWMNKGCQDPRTKIAVILQSFFTEYVSLCFQSYQPASLWSSLQSQRPKARGPEYLPTQ